jgi:hypothetical protein
MSNSQLRENFKPNQETQPDCLELVMLYNRLDNLQKVEFKNELEKLIKQPVLPQRIEEYLFSLSSEQYD